VSGNLPVTTNIKMIEVFMLFVLIFTFADILLQTYVHYLLQMDLLRRKDHYEDDRLRLHDLLDSPIGKSRGNNLIDKLGNNNRKPFNLSVKSTHLSQLERDPMQER
jgi:hypothetical protein